MDYSNAEFTYKNTGGPAFSQRSVFLSFRYDKSKKGAFLLSDK